MLFGVQTSSVVILIELCDRICLLVCEHNIVCLVGWIKKYQVLAFLILHPLSLDDDGSWVHLHSTRNLCCCVATRCLLGCILCGSLCLLCLTKSFVFLFLTLGFRVGLCLLSLALGVRRRLIGLTFSVLSLLFRIVYRTGR